MKDAQISSEQEDYVLSMVQGKSLAVWRDARAKPKRGVFVSRMVQRQNIVAKMGAPSRLSEEGSARVMVRVRSLKRFGANAASVL
jgi:hypothetical protein